MAQDDQEINYFVRVHNTDLDGTKPVLISLTGIKGVGRHTAKFIAETAGVEKNVLMGKLDEASVDRIREVISNYVDRDSCLDDQPPQGPLHRCKAPSAWSRCLDDR
jgi:Ribosomal protein S13